MLLKRGTIAFAGKQICACRLKIRKISNLKIIYPEKIKVDYRRIATRIVAIPVTFKAIFILKALYLYTNDV